MHSSLILRCAQISWRGVYAFSSLYFLGSKDGGPALGFDRSHFTINTEKKQPACRFPRVGAAVSFGRRGCSKAKSAAKQNPRNAQIPEKFCGTALQKAGRSGLMPQRQGFYPAKSRKKWGFFAAKRKGMKVVLILQKSRLCYNPNCLFPDAVLKGARRSIFGRPDRFSFCTDVLCKFEESESSERSQVGTGSLRF